MGLETIKARYQGCQTFLKEGCLFLSLCSIAEEVTGEKIDVLAAIAECKKRNLVSENGWIKDSTAILKLFTGFSWSRKEVQQLGKVKDNEYTVEKWSWQGGNHFRRRYVDTLINSQTVSKGVREGYYVYVNEG